MDAVSLPFQNATGELELYNVSFALTGFAAPTYRKQKVNSES